jgi:hypothetical protein
LSRDILPVNSRKSTSRPSVSKVSLHNRSKLMKQSIRSHSTPTLAKFASTHGTRQDKRNSVVWETDTTFKVHHFPKHG